MIRSRHLLLVLALAMPACVVSGRGSMAVETTGPVVVYEEPPPPRAEVQVTSRPGFVWIKGRWDWRGGRWEWVPGHWERERANHIRVAGRWELQGNRWVWIDGRWDVRAAPAPQGPRVRDHRN